MSATTQWAADNATEIATPKISVITKISKWDNYEYVEMDNMKFIRGSSEDKDSELFEYHSINNIGVLIDLLALRNQIQIQYSHDEKIIAERITTSDIKNIIKFCKRHGLPRWGLPPIYNYCINEQEVDNDIARTTILRGIIPYATENHLHIPSFIRALQWLKTDFLRIVSAHNLEEDVNIKPLLIDDDYERINDMRKHSSFDLFLPCHNPFATYWNSEKNGLFLNCENLIHLSVYYLCAIHQTGKCFGGHIKICKSCGKPFVTSNANKKYCGTPDTWGCTRNSFYEREKRKSDKLKQQ